MTGEWKSMGRLFADGWSIDDLSVAFEFLPYRQRAGRKEYFIEAGFTLETLRELHAAKKFVAAAKNGDR